jgi:hypothetical protein
MTPGFGGLFYDSTIILSAEIYGICEVWNSEGAIHADYLPHVVRINAQFYNSFNCNDVHHVIQKKT